MSEMIVNAGELNKKIQIIARQATQDADGYETVTETVVRECYAAFSRKSGREMTRDNADFGEVQVRFLIRWADIEIDRKMLVRYHGTYYEIEYVNEYGDGKAYIELICKKMSREAVL